LFKRGLTHPQAVVLMVVVTLLWSIAGVVSRHLESARAFEVTFWRSAANAVALGLMLAWLKGPRALLASLRHGGATLWWSGACWTVMFTAFMVAMSLTTVANVLITMSLAPLFTALIARVFLGHRLAGRTWAAIVVAGVGIAWMYAAEVAGGDARHLTGTLVALSVPVAGATMWTLLQAQARRQAAGTTQGDGDMTPGVLLGAVGSALLTLPLSFPFQASAHDVGLLAMLGVVQLAIPCVLAVAAGKVLKAPEASLLGLLEILFGVAWTWMGSSESPTPAVIGGGSLVIAALAANELIALRQREGGRPAGAAGDETAPPLA
jgi:drug/metabolite transporter (DMT)-like permease